MLCFASYVDLILFCMVSEFLLVHLCDGRAGVVSLTSNLPDLSSPAASKFEIDPGSRDREANAASYPWL